MLLQLAFEIGLHPKRTASTQGGEYHSACPGCGGKDRFFIQPSREMQKSTGYYQCRQCGKRGDTIQFCRDFLGLTYLEACAKLSLIPRASLLKPSRLPKSHSSPSQTWIERASAFVIDSHRLALSTPLALRLLQERGFTIETIKKFQIGWNAFNRYDAANLWNTPKQVWLPKGIVIPSLFEGQVMKLKIRRLDNDLKHGNKYIIVPGGRSSPSFFGKALQRPIIILESELDAMLLQQIAGDLCCCMAIPAGNKPDAWTDAMLRSAPQLLFSMDFDEAGSKTVVFWKSTYPQIKIWPVPRGKSPGEALIKGVNMRNWVEFGISPTQI